MRKSDERLRNYWKKVRAAEHEKKFHSFPLFREWSFANGYTTEKLLIRIDEAKPYSRENCMWATRRKIVTSQLNANIAQWDRMVDKVRAAHGMPPNMSICPCEGCPKLDKCEREDTVCATRLRYWDQQTAKLRGARR